MFTYVTVAGHEAIRAGVEVEATVREVEGLSVVAEGLSVEVEGLSVVAEVGSAVAEGLSVVAEVGSAVAAGWSVGYRAAWITCEAVSSLDAVGLTAATATALAAECISANVIAGHHHDHVPVAEDDADRALAVLGRWRDQPSSSA